jgi:hypothetical protein
MEILRSLPMPVLFWSALWLVFFLIWINDRSLTTGFQSTLVKGILTVGAVILTFATMLTTIIFIFQWTHTYPPDQGIPGQIVLGLIGIFSYLGLYFVTFKGDPKRLNPAIYTTLLIILGTGSSLLIQGVFEGAGLALTTILKP